MELKITNMSCKLIIEDEVNIKIEGLDVDVRRKLANALKFAGTCVHTVSVVVVAVVRIRSTHVGLIRTIHARPALSAIAFV